METMASISRRTLAEVVGTGFLLLAIVGSGIAADRRTDDAALTLLVNALVTAQVAGAAIGVVAANLMFDLPAVDVAQTSRAGAGPWLGEFIATFGLLTVIWGTVRSRPGATVAAAIGLYVTAAIWFTSSTGFANPAVTVGRIFTDTYTGIAPMDALPFVATQLAGAVAATLLFRWLLPGRPRAASEAVVPHEAGR